MPKHLHRLRPVIEQFKTIEPERPTKAVFGPAALKLLQETQKPYYLWFDDKGNLYFGVNEDHIELVKGTFENPPEINWMDLENAFKLGLAVAHLSFMPLTECEPHQKILTERIIPNYE